MTPAETALLPVTIDNPIGADVTITSIASSNSRFVPECNSCVVLAGGSMDVMIAFTPTDFSRQEATLSITHNPTVSIGVLANSFGRGASAGVDASGHPFNTLQGSLWRPMVGLGLDLSVRRTSPQVDMTVPSFASSRRRLGFCLLFGLWAVVTALTLERWDAVLHLPYMSAISYVSALLLNTVGVPVTLGSVPGSFAILSMDHVVFHVTRECTGVYALGLYIAAVLSYSATLPQRLQALSWGVPAFFLYSIARLMLLALAAEWVPEWTQFLHVYLLVIVNAGFLLWLWAVWVNRLAAESAS